ncbi:MAG: hypothetical protein FWG78_03790 [Coriobacteriia bacterium]|nr:hypothetical protein [Coriobacteriia bacterium]
MANYYIASRIVAYQTKQPISESEFEAIERAKRYIEYGLSIESKFNILLDNYTELEKELLSTAAEYSVHHGRAERLLVEGIPLFNRRVANLLTTARLYLDQIPHDLSSLYGKDSTQLKKFRVLTKSAYDSYIGYRVMELLRNYIQHRDLPIRSMSITSALDDRNSRGLAHYSASPKIDMSAIHSNFYVKCNATQRALLDELLATASKSQDMLPLIPYIREYVSALGGIHREVRGLLNNDLVEADALIISTIDAVQSLFGEDRDSLVAVADESGEFRAINLFERTIETRKRYAYENARPEGICRNYVTSRDDGIPE